MVSALPLVKQEHFGFRLRDTITTRRSAERHHTFNAITEAPTPTPTRTRHNGLRTATKASGTLLYTTRGMTGGTDAMVSASTLQCIPFLYQLPIVEARYTVDTCAVTMCGIFVPSG